MQLTLFFAYVFLIITFGFSALEKLWRWKSSVAYYQDYFKKTLLQKGMLFTLSAIVFIELVISIFLIIGCYEVICQKHLTFGFFGVVLGLGLLLCFLIGQRLVKDYDGARGVAIYFIINLIALLLTEYNLPA